MPQDVKEVLYSVIGSIGRDKIRSDLVAGIDAASQKYCGEIVERCIAILGKEADGDEVRATVCEALLHFMLTASQLPSERKVVVGKSELDVVVPSTKSLAKDPAKTLVIQVLKAGGDDAFDKKIMEAKQAQPNRENIWTISARPLGKNYRNYSLDGSNFKYSSIISDIHRFLKDHGVASSLKMLYG